jgi:UDP-N-acetylmuramoyl-tripeptide--D-alanyl-D-alanine ligase
MLELGKDSNKEHRELGLWASQHPEIEFWVTGTEMAAFYEACPSANWFQDKSGLVDFVQKANPETCCVLLKGSRGMKLETLLPYL